MRYSPALVLGTLAVGQAAAGNVRHASFHARRQAEAKRSPGYENVDWTKVSYDLSNVDWSSVFATQKATPAPTPAAQPEPVAQEVETSATPEPTPEPEPTSQAPAPTSEQTPQKTEEAQPADPIGDFVEDVTQFVDSIVSSMGISKAGVNSRTNNGGIWIGDDSEWKMEFLNDANKNLVMFCWQANGFTGMTINVNQPAISVGLKPGEKTAISFAADVPAACAPAFEGSELAMFGAVKDTWIEATFGNYGAFDVSRNVWMQGTNISAKGSKCTSDMETCVFKCKNNMESCEKGTDYDLFNCGAGSGGGGGYDSVMQGTGGGCAMGATGETIKVTIS